MGICLTTAIIFDFDGTLVDSEQAIYRCFQSITKKLAPERTDYAKNILIGPPLPETASEILGPNHQGLLDDFVRLFIEMHDEKVIFNTQPYEGVNKTLKLLSKKKIPLAIATNKRESPTLKLVNFFKWENYFKIILCSNSDGIFRTKSEMIKTIISQNMEFQNSYYIGDTIKDFEAASENNLDFILANYGYESKEKIKQIKKLKKINSFYEIINTILY